MPTRLRCRRAGWRALQGIRDVGQPGSTLRTSRRAHTGTGAAASYRETLRVPYGGRLLLRGIRVAAPSGRRAVPLAGPAPLSLYDSRKHARLIPPSSVAALWLDTDEAAHHPR